MLDMTSWSTSVIAMYREPLLELLLLAVCAIVEG
jgi:hypothetical protein